MKLSTVLFSLLVALTLASHPIQAQPYVNDMISVEPQHFSLPWKTNFTIIVTNLRNESVWIFCLAQANITRLDAPIFKTLAANASYEYKFLSPEVNQTLFNQTSVYSIFFGAVDSQATSFQTVEVVIDITTVEWINLRLQELTIQNAKLLRKIEELIDRASFNNVLVIGVVFSNVFWVAVILGLRLHVRKPSPLAVENSPQP